MSANTPPNQNAANNTPQKAPIIWTTTLIFSLTALTSLIIVPWYGFTQGYQTSAWVLFVIFAICSGMSITGGYHRLWSHKSYEAHAILRLFYALWGACALQNSILIWASGHRRHHRHVDDNDKDPYSAKRGFWFSHIGWMLREYPSGQVDFDNVKDLERDAIVMWQHNHYIKLVLLMNVGLPLLLGFMLGDVLGTFLIVGVLRLVFTHHTTFFINSLAHIWGRRPYTDENTARDNDFLALFTYGEGYHNYHHYFQTDYRNGIRWWQFDPTKWLINVCSWMNLASNLKRVPDFKIQRALVTMQFKKANQYLEDKTSPSLEKWRTQLESEYEQFKALLSEWQELQAKWYRDKRDQLAQKWETAALHTRFKELEYGLKMQRKRLVLLTAQFA